MQITADQPIEVLPNDNALCSVYICPPRKHASFAGRQFTGKIVSEDVTDVGQIIPSDILDI